MIKASFNLLLISMISICASCGNSSDSVSPQSIDNKVEVSKIDEGLPIETKGATYFPLKRFDFDEKQVAQLDLQSLKEELNKIEVRVLISQELVDGSKLVCSTRGVQDDSIPQEVNISRRDLIGKMTIDLSSRNGNEFKVTCYVSQFNRQVQDTFIEYTVYKDLIIEGEKRISDLGLVSLGKFKFSTILILPDSTLLSGGQTINISGKNLISAGSIKSWSDRDSVNSTIENENGAHGGKVYINVDNATGRLDLYFNGKNGGLITKLPNKPTDVPVPVGIINNKCRIDMEITDPMSPAVFDKNLEDCIRGARGFTGNQGLQGADGGNSGFINLKINSLNNIVVELNKAIPGNKSFGGVRGDGGEGGEGQSPKIHPYGTYGIEGCIAVHLNFRSMCERAMRAAIDRLRGPRGNEGMNGKDGKDGKVESSQIIFKNEIFGI